MFLNVSQIEERIVNARSDDAGILVRGFRLRLDEIMSMLSESIAPESLCWPQAIVPFALLFLSSIPGAH